MLVEIEEFLDVVYCHFEDSLFWREVEFLFEEGVIEVQNIDLFGTSLKILIPFLRRVQITILFKYLPVEPHVTGV